MIPQARTDTRRPAGPGTAREWFLERAQQSSLALRDDGVDDDDDSNKDGDGNDSRDGHIASNALTLVFEDDHELDN